MNTEMKSGFIGYAPQLNHCAKMIADGNSVLSMLRQSTLAIVKIAFGAYCKALQLRIRGRTGSYLYTLKPDKPSQIPGKKSAAISLLSPIVVPRSRTQASKASGCSSPTCWTDAPCHIQNPADPRPAHLGLPRMVSRFPAREIFVHTATPLKSD